MKRQVTIALVITLAAASVAAQAKDDVATAAQKDAVLEPSAQAAAGIHSSVVEFEDEDSARTTDQDQAQRPADPGATGEYVPPTGE
jgi:hypothetical protein